MSGGDEGAAARADRRPFARRGGGGTAEGLPWEGRTDEAAFRAALARLGCSFERVGARASARLEARAGDLLMGRLDPRTGRAETRHAFPRPEEARPGQAEVEVQGAAGTDGATPFLVRWHNAATGRAEALGLRCDLDAFVVSIAGALDHVWVTGPDGARADRAPARAARRGDGR